jgi:hypothetical protein
VISEYSFQQIKQLSNKELYKYSKLVGKTAKNWKNTFISLLPEVYKRRLYKQKGFCSIHEFAAKLGGITYGVVDDVLRLMKKFEKMPKLLELIPEVGVSKLKTIAAVVTPQTAEIWGKRAETLSKSALETLIREYRKETSTKKLEEKSSSSRDIYTKKHEHFGMDLAPETIFQLKLLKQKFEKEKGEPLCWNDVMKMAAQKLLKTVSRQKERKIKKTACRTRTNSRYIPVELRRKQSKKCVVQGCNKPAEVIHHPDRYSITKNHNKLVSMCKTHHELAHRGHIDEKNDFKTLIDAVIDPIKENVDKKMFSFVRGAPS